MAGKGWVEADETRRDLYYLTFARGLLADGDMNIARISTSAEERRRFLEFARDLAEEALELVDS